MRIGLDDEENTGEGRHYLYEISSGRCSFAQELLVPRAPTLDRSEVLMWVCNQALGQFLCFEGPPQVIVNVSRALFHSALEQYLTRDCATEPRTAVLLYRCYCAHSCKYQ